VVDLTKYETLISDLSALEAEVAILKSKFNDTVERNDELEVSLGEAQQEQNSLHQRLSEFEAEALQLKQASQDVISLNTEEREELKSKIRELISKIENHLSAGLSH
jgi:predicted  nucleic acid-binding Zn-ribbon protein